MQNGKEGVKFSLFVNTWLSSEKNLTEYEKKFNRLSDFNSHNIQIYIQK